MEEKEIKACHPIVAMICLAIVGSTALYLGIDGTFLAAMVAVMAGLGGYTVGKKTGD